MTAGEPSQGTPILIVEDDPDTVALIKAISRELDLDAVFRVASTLADAVVAVQQLQFACALVDLGLPDSDGMNAVRRLVDADPDVALVVLTGREEELGLAAVQAGAQDYMRKAELSPRSLNRAMRYALERHRVRAELRAANLQLAQFADMVAHDLQAPVTTAASHVRLIRHLHGDALATEVVEMLDDVTACHERIQSLIGDTLQLAQSRTTPLKVTAVNIGELIRSAMQTVGLDDSTVAVADHLPTVLGDASLLEAVFENLLHNAMTYVRAGHAAEIAVSSEVDNAVARIEIADRGSGIPAHLTEAAFDAYRRLPSSVGHPGTGLGLTIARHVVERLGGRVWCEPRSDGGTAVTILLARPPVDSTATGGGDPAV